MKKKEKKDLKSEELEKRQAPLAMPGYTEAGGDGSADSGGADPESTGTPPRKRIKYREPKL